MHFHSQNLNDKPGGIQGYKWRHGRCWLMWGDGRKAVCCEWHLFSGRFGMEIDLGTHDHALAASVSLLLFSFYAHLESFKLQNWITEKIKRPDEKYGNGRTIGWRVFDSSLWIDLWNDPMESRRADPWWWHVHFNPQDFFLGRSVYSERTLRTTRVDVPMPEAAYPATVRIFESTWKRPLSLLHKRVVRSEITPDTPIPFPGKGENSWDCGEDATHSMTCSAADEQGAVSALVASVLRDRYRNGGKDWRPQEVRA